MLKEILKSWVARVIISIYVVLLFFWAWINLNGLQEGFYNNLFGALYPIISIIGALYGLLVVAKKWGGFKSVAGRGVSFLCLGLFGEAFGQLSWTYFTLIKQVEVPYPSIADLGYFSIIPFYGLAMYNFSRASGVRVNLKSFFGKFQAVLIPILMVGIAYFLFLKNIEVDLSNPLKTFLDFGYPGFEAIAVSIGILTYSLSKGVLGGIMRPRIFFLIFALLAQYVTDYTFTYTVGTGTYFNGGIVDLMYTTSITIMSLGIILFAHTVSDPEK